MADSVLTELNFRPRKIPKLEKACQGSSSSSSSKQRVFKFDGKVEDDDYLRQYLLYYYQFVKSEGFTIDWEQLEYVFQVRSLDHTPPLNPGKSNAQVIREMTLTAIDQHNQDEGTQLAFVQHVEANYQYAAGLLCWITFWARDMSLPSQESKIYQAKVWRRGKLFKILMFRPKPTDQEIASVEVEPPSPRHYLDSDEPPVEFARAGPEDGVPFVFSRDEGRTWS